jgi:surfeit locus 1 family protein
MIVLPRRFKFLIAFALAAAAGCVRLGFWQLDRLAQRRARNAIVFAGLRADPVDASLVPRDTNLSHYRRVRVTGTPDYANEIVLGPRARNVDPGVYIITPIRIAGSDTAVLVNRGWVYSPDAMSVDLSRFHEDTTTFVGYAEPVSVGGVAAEIPGHARTLRRMQREALSRAIPYPVAPFYVIVTGDSALSVSGSPILRLGEPPIDEGPHKSYAFQWFGFALVALVGVGVIVRNREMSGDPDDA